MKLIPRSFAVLWFLLVLAMPEEAKGQVETVLHNFADGSVPGDGTNPTTPLVLGVDGSYYGVTLNGGNGSSGTMFKMTPLGTVTIIHHFNNGVPNDGANPRGLILASDGNFYGITSKGGSANWGMVFKMTSQGVYSVIHSFRDGSVTNDGESPQASLVEGSDGKLYGTTSVGGSNNQGTVFAMTKGGAEAILHFFGNGGTTNDGANPVSSVMQASDGNFYGTTQFGGYDNADQPAGAGTVFQVTPTGAFQIIHSFSYLGTTDLDGTTYDGAVPVAGLVQGPDGALYGTTSFCFAGINENGEAGSGVVYKIVPTIVPGHPETFSETVLHRFYTNSVLFYAVAVESGLVLGPDGNFYGTSLSTNSSAPASQNGTIFKITPQGQVTFLHLFGDGTVANDGYQPQSNLIVGADGNLYGTTYYGGSANGTIFKLTTDRANLTSSPSVIGTANDPFSYQITATNSPTSFSVSPSLPAGLSLNASTGLISGTPTAAAVGTTTIALTMTNSKGSGVASLTFNISSQPVPTITSNLTLYGTVNTPLSYSITATDNPNSYGASTPPPGLSISTSTGAISGTPTTPGTYSVNLTASNGTGPGSKTLTMTIFASPPALSQEYKVLHLFGDGSVPNDGINPVSNLVQGLDGNFYGVTYDGGTGNYGTLFKVTVQGAVSIIHNFLPESTSTNPNAFYDGGKPNGIIVGSDGNFYGTTQNYGAVADGTVFKMTPDGKETILHNFGDFTVTNDGTFPEAGLIQASDGNFYGTTGSGGSAGFGTIYKITPLGQLTILHSFADGSVAHDGSQPYAALIQGADGYLYGTTELGGTASEGTIFRITTSGALTILHNFGDGSVANDGALPDTSLIQAYDGNFYGTTQTDNSFGKGVVYKMTPGGTVSILHSFGDGTVSNDGSSPLALIQGYDGNLYGTTNAGGLAAEGTAFKMTTVGVETIIHQFLGAGTGEDGAEPGHLFQGTDGNFYGVTSGGGAGGVKLSNGQYGNSGNGIIYTFVSGFTPTIPPTIIGATTVQTPVQNPLFYVIQALESQATSVSGFDDSLAKSLITTTSSSLISKALDLFLPDASSPTSWILSGSLPPNVSFDSSSGAATGQVIAAPGMYTFSITPHNNAGAGIQRAVTMYVETSPTIKSAAHDTPTQGVPYTYQVVVSDYDFPFSYSATQLPAWLSVDTAAGVLSGTPPGPGTYKFNPIANNLSGSSGLQVTLTVAATSSNAPQITSATTVNVVAGTTFTYQIAANNSPTGYTATAVPPGLLFNAATGLIFGIPTTAGTYFVPITATNASTTYASVVTITVDPLGAPTLSATLSASGTYNTTFSYQIPAMGSVTSYTTSTLPTGLSLNSSTGVISGKPTVTGTFTVTVTASNSLGTATSTLTLTIPVAGFTSWAATYLSSYPANLQTATANPAHDGVSNLMKYALNMNPTIDSIQGLPTTSLTTMSGQQYLTLTFTQYTSYTDIAYTVQVSPDLTSWNSGPTYTTQVSSTPIGNGVYTTVVRDDIQISPSAPHRYIRLQVNQQ